MATRPNSRRNLDIAIERAFGKDEEFVAARTAIANVIVSQMLPNAVLKGGSSLKMKYGERATRLTSDLDAAHADSIEEFEDKAREGLAMGWNGFSGVLVRERQAHPRNVPPEYVMQPFSVKLSYNGKPWCTVSLEMGHNEIGDADLPTYALDDNLMEAFATLGFPKPNPAAHIPTAHQIAQKLHGASEHNSKRAHDLIDLQIIVSSEEINYIETKQVCERLFKYRKRQEWPPAIEKGTDWDGLYFDQAEGLAVSQSVDEAIVWANALIKRISEAED